MNIVEEEHLRFLEIKSSYKPGCKLVYTTYLHFESSKGKKIVMKMRYSHQFPHQPNGAEEYHSLKGALSFIDGQVLLFQRNKYLTFDSERIQLPEDFLETVKFSKPTRDLDFKAELKGEGTIYSTNYKNLSGFFKACENHQKFSQQEVFPKPYFE